MKRILPISILILFVFGITVVYLMRSPGSQEEPGSVPSPSPYQLETVNSWEGVTPGKTTDQMAVALLGKPESIVNKGAYQTYLFPSENQYWKNEVNVTNQTVTFIKERLFPPQEQSYKKLSEDIREPVTKLFGPDHDSGFYLMTYPENGIAFFVHSPKDQTYEVWRFQPAPLRSLLTRSEFAGYYISPLLKKE